MGLWARGCCDERQAPVSERISAEAVVKEVVRAGHAEMMSEILV